MSRPERLEIEAAGQLGHVFVSKGPAGHATARPAVVLIHGIGVSHRYLSKLHGLLAESADTYSIDLPGFGATPRPEKTLPVADHASYLLGALEQLGVLEFVLVGHSMGTQFAIEATLQQPGRISQLVLMAPVVDPLRRTVVQQALALGRDSLFFESPSSNALVFTDYFRCGPGWYLENPARHDGLPHGSTDHRSHGAGPRPARGQRPGRLLRVVPPVGRTRSPGATARNRRHRARRAAQPLRGSRRSHPGLRPHRPNGQGSSQERPA